MSAPAPRGSEAVLWVPGSPAAAAGAGLPPRYEVSGGPDALHPERTPPLPALSVVGTVSTGPRPAAASAGPFLPFPELGAGQAAPRAADASGEMTDFVNFFSGGDLYMAEYMLDHLPPAAAGSAAGPAGDGGLAAALEPPPDDFAVLPPGGRLATAGGSLGAAAAGRPGGPSSLSSASSSSSSSAAAAAAAASSAPAKPDRKRAANNEASKRYRARKRARMAMAEQEVDVLKQEKARLSFRLNDMMRQVSALHRSLTLSHNYANQAHARLVALQAENDALRAEVVAARAQQESGGGVGGGAAAAAAAPATPSDGSVTSSGGSSTRTAPAKAAAAAAAAPSSTASTGALSVEALRRLVPNELQDSVERVTELFDGARVSDGKFDLAREHDALIREMADKLRDEAEVGTASATNMLDKIYLCCQLRNAVRERALNGERYGGGFPGGDADSDDGVCGGDEADCGGGDDGPGGDEAKGDAASRRELLWDSIGGALGLGEDQARRLAEVRAAHREQQAVLSKRRGQAISRINTFLLDRVDKWPQLRSNREAGTRELLAISPLMAELKAVMADESSLLDRTLSALREFLSARQEAALHLRLSGRDVDTLSSLRLAWSSA